MVKQTDQFPYQRSSASRRPLPALLHLEPLEERTLMSVDVALTAPGTNATAYTPPDTIGAASYNYYIEGVNLTLRFMDNGGNLLATQTFQSFFAPLGGVKSLSDPIVMFDEYTGQFAIGVIDYSSTSAAFDFAVSNDEYYGDGWNYARYDMHDSSNALNDYPRCGYNADAYFCGFNMFYGNSYHNVDLLTISKGDMTGYKVQVSGGSSNFTLVPAIEHQVNPGDPEYLVEVGSTSSIKVARMTNYFSGTPTIQFYSIGVPSFSNAVAATQKGSSTKITANDDRMLSAAMFNGQLVATHTVSHFSVDSARWYQFDTTGSSPVLVQEGEVNPGGNTFTFFPAIDINYAEGDIGIVYMECSSNEYLSIYAAGQSIYDAPNTMQPGQVVFAGTGVYSSSRAGDYSGISIDPNDGYTFWGASEYKNTGTWSTGIAAFGISPAGPVANGGHAARTQVAAFSLPVRADDAGAAAANTTPTVCMRDDAAGAADTAALNPVQPAAEIMAMGLRQDVAPVEISGLTQALEQDNVWNGVNL